MDEVVLELNYESYQGPPPGNVRDSITKREDLMNRDLMRKKCKVYEYKDTCMIVWDSVTEYLSIGEFSNISQFGFITLANLSVMKSVNCKSAGRTTTNTDVVLINATVNNSIASESEAGIVPINESTTKDNVVPTVLASIVEHSMIDIEKNEEISPLSIDLTVSDPLVTQADNIIRIQQSITVLKGNDISQLNPEWKGKPAKMILKGTSNKFAIN